MAATATSRATLLVVDDDPELRELITAPFLAKQGYQVLAMHDGAATDAAIASGDVSLVILDLMLPGEDGLSIARRLKRSTDIPIIISA